MDYMKVEQFHNKNQFHLYSNMMYEQENGRQIDILQSYDSTVVEINILIHNGHINEYYITLGCDWDYSTTTSKHVYMFLEEYGNVSFYGVKNKRDYVRKLIESGKIAYNENMR